MTIFWRLLFGHFLADFTFQSSAMNEWKRSSFWGMITHCGIHPICYAALTWPYLGDVWVDLSYFQLQGWLCVFIVFAGHFLEDQWRVFTIFKYKTPDNTLYFFWDQFVHYAIIFAVIPVGLREGIVELIPEKWPVLGCLFVLITHACTVLIYFIEKDLYGGDFPRLREKYFTMAERLILGLFFLIPSNFFILPAMGWLVLMRSLRTRAFMGLSWLSYYLGGAMAVFCGLAARLVYYS
jgi:hypothetical protein